MSEHVLHAPSRIAHEVRSVLAARDDVELMELEEGRQPLAERPEFHELFGLKTQVQAYGGAPMAGVPHFAPAVRYLLSLFLDELKKRSINPQSTRPPFFEGTNPWVFFHALGYPMAIRVECPDVADITTVATLSVWLSVDSDCL